MPWTVKSGEANGHSVFMMTIHLQFKESSHSDHGIDLQRIQEEAYTFLTAIFFSVRKNDTFFLRSSTINRFQHF